MPQRRSRAAPGVRAIARKYSRSAPGEATTASITPTLPSASTAGNLLVAVLGNHNTGSSAGFSGPANWVSAVGVFGSGTGRVEIWYYANNPGGITSATFTHSSWTTRSSANSASGLAPRFTHSPRSTRPAPSRRQRVGCPKLDRFLDQR